MNDPFLDTVRAEIDSLISASPMVDVAHSFMEVLMRRSWLTREASEHIREQVVLGDGFVELLVEKSLSWWNDNPAFSDFLIPAGRYKVTNIDEDWFITRFGEPTSDTIEIKFSIKKEAE